MNKISAISYRPVSFCNGFISKPTKQMSGLVVPQGMKYHGSKMGNIRAYICMGDMTKIKADAYIVPEFNACVSEGGVGRCLYTSGAKKGMDDYEKHVKGEPLKTGDIYACESGGGNSRYLIHCATVDAENEQQQFDVVKSAVHKALCEVQRLNLKSVAIPCLGTGIVGCLTYEQSAQAILNAVNDFANNSNYSMDVALVPYENEDYITCANVLTKKMREKV